MKQFALPPAFIFNKLLITLSVTKQEQPKYQVLRDAKYQIFSLKREISKKNLPKQTLW